MIDMQRHNLIAIAAGLIGAQHRGTAGDKVSVAEVPCIADNLAVIVVGCRTVK